MGFTDKEGAPELELVKELSLAELASRTQAMAQDALLLIQRFLAKQLTIDELSDRLRALDASSLLTANWKVLTGDSKGVAVLEILQLIAFLPEEVAYQIERYGASSLADDRDQLLSGLGRLHGKSFPS
ncbi:MAG: hypothetical protein ACOX87_10635 [Chloroflexota bacterium]|jgi:hypothetical protein